MTLKALAFAALSFFSVATHAQSAELTLGDFEFTPPAQVFISTDPLSFFDNVILDVGGLNATFGSQSMVVYSLERDYGNPVGPTQYTSFTNVSTAIGQLFTVAGTPANSVESAALQLAIWQLNSTQNFDVVDDLDGANVLAQTWVSSISAQTPVASLFSLENKSYNYFVTATTPIPEPGTMAMLLAGIGLGAVKLRRKGLSIH